jgi:hypothetical protein
MAGVAFLACSRQRAHMQKGVGALAAGLDLFQLVVQEATAPLDERIARLEERALRYDALEERVAEIEAQASTTREQVEAVRTLVAENATTLSDRVEAVQAEVMTALDTLRTEMNKPRKASVGYGGHRVNEEVVAVRRASAREEPPPSPVARRGSSKPAEPTSTPATQTIDRAAFESHVAAAVEGTMAHGAPHSAPHRSPYGDQRPQIPMARRTSQRPPITRPWSPHRAPTGPYADQYPVPR